MKIISRNNIFILISLIIFFSSNSSGQQNNDNYKNFDFNDGPPDDIPPGKIQDLEQQKEQLESDYKKKLEENNKLKKQIEKNIKNIKILLTTGIIMFSIIIYISFKIYLKYSRNKSIKKEIKKFRINNRNKNKHNKIISSSNSSIEKSNYNLLNSKNNINKNISNTNEAISNNQNNPNNNSFVPLEEEKNYDAPKMADYSNIVINDDNKTLTNNPDLFVPSRMDRILYKPYSKEEIK